MPIAIAAMIASSAVIGAYGAWYESNNQADAAARKAGDLRNEAYALSEQAVLVDKKIAESGKQTQQAQEAAYTKAGVELKGSPLLTLAETARITSEKQHIYASQVAMEIENYMNQANQYESMVDQIKKAGWLNVGSSLLMGGGKTFSVLNQPSAPTLDKKS